MIEENDSDFGFGVMAGVQLAMFILKIAGQVRWSWWIVMSPILAVVAVMIVVCAILLIGGLGEEI